MFLKVSCIISLLVYGSNHVNNIVLLTFSMKSLYHSVQKVFKIKSHLHKYYVFFTFYLLFQRKVFIIQYKRSIKSKAIYINFSKKSLYHSVQKVFQIKSYLCYHVFLFSLSKRSLYNYVWKVFWIKAFAIIMCFIFLLLFIQKKSLVMFKKCMCC